jgi:tRNA pseudouridine55 synthase
VSAAEVILYPKPAGVTSHDVVARVRRGRRRGTKVGHAGTLDPFATGLLILLVGQATRTQRFFMALPKTYRVVARLGWVSDTGDRDGRLTQTGRVPERLELPTGRILQRPPAYSAVKVAGERLYAKARRGEAVEGEPRSVSVHSFELLWRDADRVGLEVECSSGTYVRQLVAGLGDAYCLELARTRIGSFRLEDADPKRPLALKDALGFLPARELASKEAVRVSHGGLLQAGADAVGGADDTPAAAPAVRLLHEGRLVALAERRRDGLVPLVVFGP